MFQPSTSEIRSESALPERETVIKFVISGPFLNAEAAHTQWANEPAGPDMHDLLRRLAELERKLDDERELVEDLRRQLDEAPAPAPAPVTPPAEPVALAEPIALAEPVALTKPEVRSEASPVAEPVGTIAAPAPPRLSTAARTPPPKVRGLRRMIGALRHL